MAETKIEWANYTFNPWRGCTKISPGCANCYAEKLSHRNPKTLGVWGDAGTRVMAAESYWRLPRKWELEAKAAGERRRVFCASLADVFEDRPELVAPRVRLFHLISETRHLDWLLLTKRPENIRRFHGGDGAARSWPETFPPNVWAGTSVESAEYLHRIDTLKACGARVLFLSIEPLLGALPTLGEYLDGIDWVIVGGESGPHARPMHPDWVRSIRDQCQAVGVAFLFKQWGEYAPGINFGRDDGTYNETPAGTFPAGLRPTHYWEENGGHEEDVSVRVGKKKAGRLLDGREWNEFPVATH